MPLANTDFGPRVEALEKFMLECWTQNQVINAIEERLPPKSEVLTIEMIARWNAY